MSSWVVGRSRVAGSGDVWIWGRVTVGPGFDEVFYTAPDGWSPADITGTPNVDEILFTVEVESEVASKRDTFPSSSAPPARSDVIGAMGIPAGDAD